MLKQEGAGLTPQSVTQRLAEEVSVLNAIADERLPAEIAAKKLQIKALKSVVEAPYLGTDEIAALRSKLDATAREVQELVEKKVSISKKNLILKISNFTVKLSKIQFH